MRKYVKKLIVVVSSMSNEVTFLKNARFGNTNNLANQCLTHEIITNSTHILNISVHPF